MKTLIIEELVHWTLPVPDDMPDTNEDGVLEDFFLAHRGAVTSGPSVQERYCYCDLPD